MIDFDWHRIRVWGRSQHAGFEQLCCQLAALEPAPAVGAEFVRNGRPDGGVECFWRTPTGEIHAWQAKFFPDGLERDQWRQVEESIETALASYPSLCVFRLCVPYDLPNAGGRSGRSARMKWEAIVRKWQARARAAGRNVEFEWWGDHELTLRLHRDEHVGRVRFWFDRTLFSADWYQRRLEIALRIVGERYRPKLNVDLPVAQNLDGLGRVLAFQQRLEGLVGGAKRHARDCHDDPSELVGPATVEEFRGAVEAALRAVAAVDIGGLRQLAIEPVRSAIRHALDATWKLRIALRSARKADPPLPVANEGASNKKALDVQWVAYKLDQLRAALADLLELFDSPAMLLAERPALLLTGEAGSGKTHLLCDVASERIGCGLPTILVLGEHVAAPGNPWPQIIASLDLGNITVAEFLGAVQANAQAANGRALLMIDAVNEGAASCWKSGLGLVESEVSARPELGLAVSVRSTFVGWLVAEPTRERFIEVVHPGFAGAEDVATRIYFEHHKIRNPAVPLLLPEFSNPLFLSLLCRSIAQRRLNALPPGIEGFRDMLAFLFDGTEARVAHQLEYSPSDRLVTKAVRALAGAMVAADATHLARSEAQNIVDGIFRPSGSRSGLYRCLVHENILVETHAFAGTQVPELVVRFAFERVADHLRAEVLVAEFLDSESWKAAFLSGGRLHRLVEDEWVAYKEAGLFEALALASAETCGLELLDLLPAPKHHPAFWLAFVRSLPWRRPDRCTRRTVELFRRALTSQRHPIREEAEEVLFALAPRHDLPMGAAWLHGRHAPLTMPERDAFWSILVFRAYDQEGDNGGGPIHRLLDWALRTDGQALTGAVALAASTSIAWFLTTSHRTLRDRATKALVALLTGRLDILRELLDRFRDIGEFYVQERLYAVAYGCAARSAESTDLRALASLVFARVFADGSPPDHILLRDHARGVLELAAARGCLPSDVEPARFRPPYRSPWPDTLPEKEDLAPLFQASGQEYPDRVYHSVAQGDDFDAYVIGTNGGHFPFLRQRLGEAEPLGPNEVVAQFVANLSASQRASWTELLRSRGRDADGQRRKLPRKSQEKVAAIVKAMSKEELRAATERFDAERKAADAAFRATLAPGAQELFDEVIGHWLDGHPTEWRHRIRGPLLHRAVLQRILDLGWTPSLFHEFDRSLPYDGRTAHKPERLGKKYQWIAWHSVLARLSDNFKFADDSYGSDAVRAAPFDGAWQLDVRDLDPTCVAASTPRNARSAAWWSPSEYDLGRGSEDDVAWIEVGASLPAPEVAFRTRQPDDGSRWWVLEAYRDWREAAAGGDDYDGIARRHLWYWHRAYVVRRDDADRFQRWGQAQNFMGRWMPENRERTARLYLREYWWSPAFRDESGSHDWCEPDPTARRSLPCSVVVPTQPYMAEQATQDCSVEDTVHILLPTAWLATFFRLRHGSRDGEYVDETGRLAFVDPSVFSPGPGALLMREDLYPRLLAGGFDLVWTLLGEQQIGSWDGRAQFRDHGVRDLSGAWRWDGERWVGGMSRLDPLARQLGRSSGPWKRAT